MLDQEGIYYLRNLIY